MLQYFDHQIRRDDLLEKTLMLGKTEDKTRRGRKGMRCSDIVTDSMNMNLSKFWEMEDRGLWSVAMGSQTAGHYLGTEQQHKIYVCVC